MTSLNLKRVLITGGASGIGRALALAFSQGGAEIVLTDIDEQALEATSEEIRSRDGRCRAYRLDVTNHRQIQEVRERLHAEAGSIDILINNAGIVYGGPFDEVPLDKHLRTYEINTMGLVAATHVFFPDVIASPAGHFVFIASASGFVGLPNGTSYASSKWAAIGFAESIRAELTHRKLDHVHVTTVCPSYVDTGLFDGVKPPKTTRLLTPDEVAGKVVAAVERNKVWVMEPWIVKLTPVLKHALPDVVGDTLADVLGANASMDTWRGHDA
ncbi:MAG: SDR family oxidoreductase [Acidobacteriota bacterium]